MPASSFAVPISQGLGMMKARGAWWREWKMWAFWGRVDIGDGVGAKEFYYGLVWGWCQAFNQVKPNAILPPAAITLLTPPPTPDSKPLPTGARPGPGNTPHIRPRTSPAPPSRSRPPPQRPAPSPHPPHHATPRYAPG